MTTSPAQLVTPAEAASLLRISRASIFRLLADGSIPSLKVGAARRIRLVDLDAFVSALSQAA